MKGVQNDDEFYGVEFSQVSDEGVREVLPLTYALMIWWKVRMENEDTIDISEGSLSSMLQFDSGFEADQDSKNLEEGDEIKLDTIIECSEGDGLISLYTYVPKPIPEQLASDIFTSLIDINPYLSFGHFEAYKTGEGGNIQYYLRYKASALLNGIRVGRVDAIENMVAAAHINTVFGIDFFAGNESVNSWLLMHP